MNFFRFTCIRKKKLQQLQEEQKNHEVQISHATAFVKEIERGNLEATYNTEGQGEQQDTLTTSLLSMRDQMKKFSLDEAERKWASEGFAQFVEILRDGDNDIAALADSVLSNLVTYMKVNQGAIYMLNDDDEQDHYIEMLACYAYERKKHMEQRIALGQGILGQVMLEKETLYMTNIPDNFIRITSGLGEALPKCLLVVPLKTDEKVMGLLEMASFDSIPQYQIDFVERLGESIASSILSVKTSHRTRLLLEESRQHTEEMRAQEEEMRQNMEELSATQEEMQRVIREVETQEAYVRQLLDTTGDLIYTIDKGYRVVMWNKAFADSISGLNRKMEKGSYVLELFESEEERREQAVCYERALKGETFTTTTEAGFEGVTLYFLTMYAPLRNPAGEIVEIAIYSKNITEEINAKKQSQKLLEESQHQTEELKAQEEEMRQNMEELSATQEEMERVLTEVQRKESFMRDLINATNDSIITVDRAYKMVMYNRVVIENYESFGMQVSVGMSVFDLFDESQKPIYKNHYDRALAGESFEINENYQVSGKTTYYAITYTGLRDGEGNVIGAAAFAKDITALMEAKKEAEQQTEEVRAQEEELRQNMEELSATQEEMERILREVQRQEAFTRDLLNATNDSIITVDPSYKIVMFNKTITKNYEAFGMTVEPGMEIFSLFSEEQRPVYKGYYDRALAGEFFEVNERYDGLDGAALQHYAINYTPLRDEQGKIIGAAAFAKNVTDVVNARIEAEQQTEEVRAQEEEIRQNMEELSATQEEMQRILTEVQSNEHYIRNLLDESKDSIVTFDEEFQIVHFNKQFASYFEANGITIDRGFNILDIFPEVVREDKKDLYRRVLSGETVDIMDELTHGDKTSYYEVRHSPLRNIEGHVVGIAVISVDVTERNSLRAELRAQAAQTGNETWDDRVDMYRKDFVREVMLGCQISAHVVDERYRLLDFNDIFRDRIKKFAGHTVVLGMELPALVENKTEANFTRKQLKRAFKGEAFQQMLQFFRDKQPIYIIQNYRPLKDSMGKVVAVGIFNNDVSELMEERKINDDMKKSNN